jgi:2-isopropylmalate synthase
MTKHFEKYRPYPTVDLAERRWPSRILDRAPAWCSVDLRDGNQALIEPMGVERKLRMYELLIELGFKEIEVGFPAASETERAFLRKIIEEGRVPDDVTLQVLTQSRPDLIDATFEAIRGARRVIVHLYNSTSEVQRRVVFGLDEEGIIDIAVRGTRQIRQLAEKLPETEIVLEYSPESFTGTELPFALRVVEAVLSAWGASPERKVIVNLPATVEMSTPNVFADRVEWLGRNLRDRDSVVLSVHPHNDRGTAIAAAELAMLAGAERVEGTLFGNGERTGNVDVVVLALNLHTQGVDPGLRIEDINAIAEAVTHCNRLPIHPRHPYVGDLVFTAFSGSHQDAIRKGFADRKASGSPLWEVPYLPIDPQDLGRTYEAIIRINSQSGKGGIAYVMEEDHGFRLPRKLQIEFSRAIQKVADETGEELSSERIREAFEEEFVGARGPCELVGFETETHDAGAHHRVAVQVRVRGALKAAAGVGRGPIEAFVAALREASGLGFRVADYSEHALGEGEDARAVAYVEVASPGLSTFGVGIDPNIVAASFRAVVSALNRHAARRGAEDVAAQ